MQTVASERVSNLFSILLSFALIFINPVSCELYHPTNDLVEILRQKATACPHANPQWLSLKHNSLSFFQPRPPEGRLLMITISRHAEFRISPSRADQLGLLHTKLVAVFGEHPRERVTTELALEILTRYCSSAPMNITFMLLPIVNLPNRFRVDTGHSCERLNHRSVDLNRNYAHSWGQKDRKTVPEEEPAGQQPLSEFETAVTDELVQRVAPTAYVSVHSGDVGVLVPWDSGDPVEGWVRDVANMVRRRHCPSCRVGSARTLFGYRAFGTGVDHMFGVRQVPFACTLEIYGAATDDCELMFNPTNRSMLLRTLRNWSRVLETIAREVQAVSPPKPSWRSRPERKGYVVSIAQDREVVQKKAVSIRLVPVVLLLVLGLVVVLTVQKGLVFFGLSCFEWRTSTSPGFPFAMISRGCGFVSGSKMGVRHEQRKRSEKVCIPSFSKKR